MNHAKAEFFDSQVAEPWASSAFGPGEMAKIDRMLNQAQLEKGMRGIFGAAGLRIESLQDDESGYLLSSIRT
jgi:hypothetical protein